MSRVHLFAAIPLLATLALSLGGCADQHAGPPASADNEMRPAVTASESRHGDHKGAGDVQGKHPAPKEQSKYEKELAKLPPADRELAAKQKICPVSGQPLGSMGVPCKVTVKSRDVFLCCQGCEDALKKNPDDYLAKLPR